MKGKFISVEGTEGVGKSTNIKFIKETLLKHGIEVVLTREPGGTPMAEQVREILLQKREEQVDPTAELLLVFAARAQHLNQVILPAINRGQWVLSDRFTDATYAYQGYGRGLPIELIEKLEGMVQSGFQPDATFFLDIDVSIGLGRAKARGELDRFEEEELNFFEQVRKGYHARIDASPERFVLIDAAQELPSVQEQIEKALKRLFIK